MFVISVFFGHISRHNTLAVLRVSFLLYSKVGIQLNSRHAEELFIRVGALYAHNLISRKIHAAVELRRVKSFRDVDEEDRRSCSLIRPILFLKVGVDSGFLLQMPAFSNIV